MKETASKLEIMKLVKEPKIQPLILSYLRKKHNIHIVVDFTNISNIKNYNIKIIDTSKNEVGLNCVVLSNLFNFSSYEEALESGLLEALKFIQL